MSIELTIDQQHMLDGMQYPRKIVDPRTHTEYVLVPVKDYAAVAEIIEDEIINERSDKWR